MALKMLARYNGATLGFYSTESVGKGLLPSCLLVGGSLV